MARSAKLNELLAQAKAASPNERIGYRERIAAYGDPAVVEMSDWLKSGTHPSFAVRVIGRAGELGASEQAVAALRAARPKAPALLRTDIDEQLQRLGAGPVRGGGAGGEAKAPAEPDPRLYQRLIEAAREGATLTYSEAGAPAQMNMRVPRDRALIGQMLGSISQREARAGRPMLSSIVVHKGEGSLGTGFFQLGQELELVHRGEGARTFERRMQAATFEYWQTHPDAGPLAARTATDGAAEGEPDADEPDDEAVDIEEIDIPDEIDSADEADPMED